MPTSSVKMCISIRSEPPFPRLWPSASRAQSASVVPFDHARFSSAAYSLSVNRTDKMRLRAIGRLEPSGIELIGIALSTVYSPFLCTVNERKRRIRRFL